MRSYTCDPVSRNVSSGVQPATNNREVKLSTSPCPASPQVKPERRTKREGAKLSPLPFLPSPPSSPSPSFALDASTSSATSMSARLPSLLRAQPAIRTAAPSLTRPRHFSSSPAARARELDHYEQLGVKRDSPKQMIKNKFYEVSARDPLCIGGRDRDSLQDHCS